MQERYNRLVGKALEEKSGVPVRQQPVDASNRIVRTVQNTPDVSETEQPSSAKGRIRRAPKSNLDILNEPEAL